MSAQAPSMYSPAAKAMAEKLGLKLGRSNLDEFAATLMELAKANPNIVAVTSDSRGSGKLGRSHRYCRNSSLKSASRNKIWLASRPVWRRAAKNLLVFRPRAFSRRDRWSKSRTMFVTPTFQRHSLASALA